MTQGIIVTSHNVECECTTSSAHSKLSKPEFKKEMKKNGWKFKGKPRRWICKECLEKMKEERGNAE